jgi:alpha-N-arabinofuranosidase
MGMKMLGDWRRNTLKQTLAAALGACALAAAPAAQAQSAAQVAVTVDARAEGPVISRHIFGQFAEHLGTGIYGGVWVGEDSRIPNVRGIRSDVVAALRALNVPNVRWPGGCFADEYHWRDGVGPQENRSARINSNWGGATETNEFGTHEFFDFVEQIGSEAYVSINLGSGTVKEAADWLEYMTADERTALGRERIANGRREPFRVSFLGIGNESWACGGSMTPEFYVDQMKLYARFVRNYNQAQTGENAMRRVAVGPEGANPTGGYTEAVMQAWQNRVWAWDIEGISLHFYTNKASWPPSFDSQNFGEDEYAELVADTRRMDEIIASHSAIMDRHDPEKKVALIVDEWGVWLAPLPGTNPGFLAQQNSLRDAIIAAININMFARHADRVRGANIAQMVNVLQAMVLTDGPRMVLTPTYHVFRMYTPFQDARLVPVRYDAGSYRFENIETARLDVIAARDRDGVLWLAATNVDPDDEARLRIAIDGANVRSASGQVLTAPQVNSINTFDAPEAVRPRPFSADVRNGRIEATLPAKSVVVLRLTEASN